MKVKCNKVMYTGQSTKVHESGRMLVGTKCCRSSSIFHKSTPCLRTRSWRSSWHCPAIALQRRSEGSSEHISQFWWPWCRALVHCQSGGLLDALSTNPQRHLHYNVGQLVWRNKTQSHLDCIFLGGARGEGVELQCNHCRLIDWGVWQHSDITQLKC